MTQRGSHGIQFTTCPTCNATIGVRGLARHSEQAHGIAPVTKGRKPKALTTVQASALRQAIRDGRLDETDTVLVIAKSALVRMGFLTETGEVTEAGRARLA